MKRNHWIYTPRSAQSNAEYSVPTKVLRKWNCRPPPIRGSVVETERTAWRRPTPYAECLLKKAVALLGRSMVHFPNSMRHRRRNDLVLPARGAWVPSSVAFIARTIIGLPFRLPVLSFDDLFSPLGDQFTKDQSALVLLSSVLLIHAVTLYHVSTLPKPTDD